MSRVRGCEVQGGDGTSLKWSGECSHPPATASVIGFTYSALKFWRLRFKSGGGALLNYNGRKISNAGFVKLICYNTLQYFLEYFV